MRFFIFICTGFLIFSVTRVYSQGEIRREEDIFFRNEFSGAGMLNSNGAGINVRYAKYLQYKNKLLYDFDLVYIKHSKEIKVSNPNLLINNRSFVFGKLNNFYSLRAGVGFQREMFRKIDMGGISIRYFYSGGLTAGLLKPVYYDVIKLSYDPSRGLWYVEDRTSRKFDRTLHEQEIAGRSKFLKGIDEIKVIPGAFVKFGANFEYSTIEEILHALEVGATLEIFPREIRIMDNHQNSFFFFSLYISYRFGKVIESYKKDSSVKEDE
ncbi:MAG: hypothetical protein ACOCW8_02785 [bacterium]